MNKFKLTLTALLVTSSMTTFANPFVGVADPYQNDEVTRAESRVVKEFNRFTFLESIVSQPDGSIYVSNIFDSKIHKIKNDETSVILDLKGKKAEVVGLKAVDANHILAVGKNTQGVPQVMLINTITNKMQVIAKESGAGILNGILKLNKNAFLITDSVKGKIWMLDLKKGTLENWITDEHLAQKKTRSSRWCKWNFNA